MKAKRTMAMNVAELDDFEVKILKILQEDSDTSIADISAQVGLSISPCWRRINRLAQDGYIRKRVALLDPIRLGLHIHVFVFVKLNAHGRTNLEEFSTAIDNCPEILECFVVTGAFDYLISVRTRDMQSYEAFLMKTLSRLPGVSEINSVVAMSAIKATTAMPFPD